MKKRDQPDLNPNLSKDNFWNEKEEKMGSMAKQKALRLSTCITLSFFGVDLQSPPTDRKERLYLKNGNGDI
jgi:hypothetical protein